MKTGYLQKYKASSLRFKRKRMPLILELFSCFRDANSISELSHQVPVNPVLVLRPMAICLYVLLVISSLKPSKGPVLLFNRSNSREDLFWLTVQGLEPITVGTP